MVDGGKWAGRMPFGRSALIVASLSLLALPARAGEPTQKLAEPLLRAVLERALAVGDYLPDRAMLPASPPFLLMEEIASTKLRITRAALPQATGRFVVLPYASLQEQADTSKKTLFFVVIRRVDATDDNDNATLEVGVDVVFPGSRGGQKFCCCSARDRYSRAKGSWQFVKRERTTCA